MRLSQQTYDQLKASGVAVSALLSSINSALSKKAITKHALGMKAREFAHNEKAVIDRNRLTEAEDYALVVYAFDSAILKVQDKWREKGTDEKMEWTLLPSMVTIAQQYWALPKVEATEEASLSH